MLEPFPNAEITSESMCSYDMVSHFFKLCDNSQSVQWFGCYNYLKWVGKVDAGAAAAVVVNRHNRLIQTTRRISDKRNIIIIAYIKSAMSKIKEYIVTLFHFPLLSCSIALSCYIQE